MNTATREQTEINTNLPAFGTFMPDQGGFFAGVVLVKGVKFGVVVAPEAAGETKGIWGEYGKKIDAAHLSDGLANTQTMADAGSVIAAWARKLDVNDQQDWYIPARDELELIYRNLKPSAEENACTYRDGENPSSVPPGAMYTEESPLQTDVLAYQEGGDEAMSETWYWSSTQYSASSAFVQGFSGGGQDLSYEGSEWRVRAVRRFLID